MAINVSPETISKFIETPEGKCLAVRGDAWTVIPISLAVAKSLDQLSTETRNICSLSLCIETRSLAQLNQGFERAVGEVSARVLGSTDINPADACCGVSDEEDMKTSLDLLRALNDLKNEILEDQRTVDFASLDSYKAKIRALPQSQIKTDCETFLKIIQSIIERKKAESRHPGILRNTGQPDSAPAIKQTSTEEKPTAPARVRFNETGEVHVFESATARHDSTALYRAQSATSLREKREQGRLQTELSAEKIQTIQATRNYGAAQAHEKGLDVAKQSSIASEDQLVDKATKETIIKDLTEAASAGKFKEIFKMLEDEDITPQMLASEVKTALKQGHFTPEMLKSALKAAAKQGLLTIVKTLIENGATMSRDERVQVIRLAANSGHVDVVGFLMNLR